jgi:hypothetical protein
MMEGRGNYWMAATWEGSGSTPATEILWPRYSSSGTLHTLFAVDDDSVLLLLGPMCSLGPAADDYIIIHPGKNCLAASDGPVHLLLEERPGIPEAEGP